MALQTLTRRKLTIVGAGLAISAAIPAFSASALARKRVETAKYDVLTSYEGFEVRRYAPKLIAEVEMPGTGRQATSSGFRLLADFIFGNNTTRTEVEMTAPVDRTASTKIEMTAPVDRTARGQRWVIAFTMPYQYTLETLPRPNDPRVRIREVPATYYAATRFSGSPTEARVQKKMVAFAEHARRAGLELADQSPTYARYDPPWTPSFMRRNEILLELVWPNARDAA